MKMKGRRISSELATRLLACRIPLSASSVSRLRHALPPSPLNSLMVDPARTAAHARLVISERRLPVLRSHFPSYPVLPAVEILNAMFTLSEALVMRPASVTGLTIARFHKPVCGTRMTLNVAVLGEGAEDAVCKRTFEGIAWTGARIDSGCMISSATFIMS